MLYEPEEKVSMMLVFNKDKSIVKPYKMRWGEKYVTFTEVTYHHIIRKGMDLTHVFHVTDGSMDYRLHLDTRSLHWKLMEVSDGNS